MAGKIASFVAILPRNPLAIAEEIPKRIVGGIAYESFGWVPKGIVKELL